MHTQSWVRGTAAAVFEHCMTCETSFNPVLHNTHKQQHLHMPASSPVPHNRLQTAHGRGHVSTCKAVYIKTVSRSDFQLLDTSQQSALTVTLFQPEKTDSYTCM